MIYNHPKPLPCECEKTPAQARREELEAERKALQEAKLKQSLIDAKKSKDCWESMGRECHVTNMMPHCHTCFRFGGKFQGLLRKQERDERISGKPTFEEIPMEVENK